MARIMSDPLTQFAAASPNFGFLTGHALALAIDGAQAEVYVYSDPDGALGKLRRFTETMAKLLMPRAGITSDPRNQSERIKRLASAGTIPGHIRQLFDDVRHAGNRAVHQGAYDRAAALTALKGCFDLAMWWYETETGTAAQVTFIQPSPEDPRPLRKLLEDVEARMAAMQAALDPSLDRPQPRIVIGPAVAPDGRWQGGTEVACGSLRFLVHDPVERIPAPDGSWTMMVAVARRLDGDHAAVRLRGLAIAGPGPSADAMAQALGRQAEFAALPRRKALPGLVCHDDSGEVRVLATTLPAGSTWHEVFGDQSQPLDPLIVPLALGVFADVAESLACLHGTGQAHRELSAESVIVSEAGRRGMVRDLGLAGFPRLPGEGGAYRAPEQLSTARGRPGPATDVFELASLLHHTCAAFPPAAGRAVPLRTVLPAFPEALERVLRAALDADPSRRPAMAQLASAARAGRRQFLAEVIA